MRSKHYYLKRKSASTRHFTAHQVNHRHYACRIAAPKFWRTRAILSRTSAPFIIHIHVSTRIHIYIYTLLRVIVIRAIIDAPKVWPLGFAFTIRKIFLSRVYKLYLAQIALCKTCARSFQNSLLSIYKVYAPGENTYYALYIIHANLLGRG